MLMMGFFVILWVLKPPAGKKSEGDGDSSAYLIKVAASIREAFGYIPNPNSHDPVDIHMIIKGLQRPTMNGPGERGRTESAPKGADGTDSEVTNIRPAHQATEGGKMLFEQGTAASPTKRRKSWTKWPPWFAGIEISSWSRDTPPWMICPMAPAEQKMDLSLSSQAAADYLVEKGVEPDMLRVQGCSTFEPLIQRQYTPEAQVLNRRVEVEATSTLLDDLSTGKPQNSLSPQSTAPSE